MLLLLIIIVVIIVVGIVMGVHTTPLEGYQGDYPVDVVYTWAGENHSADPRIAYNGELRYSIRSVVQNMPWVNRIFILMNPPATVPSFLRDYPEGFVTIYDHNDVIPWNYLPTTSSNSIETFLHLLPGLAEHFIYFNDDFFVTKPVGPDAFFVRGLPVHYRFRETAPEIVVGTPKGYTLRFPPRIQRSNGDNWYPHVPFPVTKSAMAAFVDEYGPYVEYVRSFRSGKEAREEGVCGRYGLTTPCLQIQQALTFYCAARGLSVQRPEGFIDRDALYVGRDNLQSLRRGAFRTFLCINDGDGGNDFVATVTDFLEDLLQSP